MPSLTIEGQASRMTRSVKDCEDLRKGAWTTEEDEKLRKYIEAHGTGHWRSVGRKAGMSCLSPSAYLSSALASCADRIGAVARRKGPEVYTQMSESTSCKFYDRSDLNPGSTILVDIGKRRRVPVQPEA